MIPASQEVAQDGTGPAESIESNPPSPDMSSERGSMNPDGSVNLGLRRRQEQSPLQLVPESVLRQNRPSPPLPSGDLTQYSSNLRQHRQLAESLTDDNRLAPITSLPATSGRQTSLSPASFLSPTRKRSFAETDYSNHAEPENTKRLSSIKSILNSAGQQSPPHAPSIKKRLGAEELTDPPPYLDARRFSNESNDLSRAERRAALQRESERMREMLAANERELAKLEN